MNETVLFINKKTCMVSLYVNQYLMFLHDDFTLNESGSALSGGALVFFSTVISWNFSAQFRLD